MGQQVNPVVFQHGCKPNQRQANQRVWIVPPHSFKQGDSKTFCLEASGTIVRFISLQVRVYLVFREFAKLHLVRFTGKLIVICNRVKQAQSRIEFYLPVTCRAKLIACFLRVAGFGDDLFLQFGTLIGSYDPRSAFGARNGRCLVKCQTAYVLCGGFPRVDGFIHTRGNTRYRGDQGLQQFFSVYRT